MKRILWLMLACVFGLALSVGTANAASSDCLNLKFNNWDSVCLGIAKSGTKNFKVSVDKNNLRKNSEIKCFIALGNGSIHSLKNCEWSFNYAGSNTQDVVVTATYVLKNNDFFSKRMPIKINFNNGSWGSNSSNSSSSKSSSKSSDDLKISVSPSSPDTYEWVKLSITTDDDYIGKINFSKIQYKSSSSASWSNISRTSSTHVSDYSSEWSNWYYRMTSSDDGEAILKNLVKFKKSGYYRIYVEDTDGNESYVQINVDTSSSSSNSNDEIKLSTNRKSPSTDQYVNLTIETDDDYVGNLSFYAKYRSSSSSSWTTISKTSRTSSTYFSDYSDEWGDGYYKMRSSDDWEVTLKDLVKFRKSGYYRIYVEDIDGNESYIEFDVDTSSSSSNYNNEFELSTNRKSPSTSQYVNLTIETDDDYVGKLTLSAKYRKSSSDSWSSISNTSSTYFTDYSDEWDDGYYKMRSSDDWEITLKDLVKFRKNGYYRIYVEDTDGNESYIQFSVGSSDDDSDDESKVSGFSSSELAKVKSVYKEWNSMISQMQKKYPSLKKDSYWSKLSTNFYNDMKDVIDNKKSRDFDTYDDYVKAFNDWYKYTTRNA